AEFHLDVVIHLAAQAGVRYSVENPGAYISARLHAPARRSTCSSRRRALVYGANTKLPFEESSAHALCGHQEGHRIDGAFLCSFVEDTDDGVPLFHVYGPWAARHGAIQIHEGDSRERTDRRVQPWPDGPRFHLHRRHHARHCPARG